VLGNLGVRIMNVTVLATEAPGQTSWRSFSRQFVEMVLAMIVGMAVLGAAVSGIFALLGHSNILMQGCGRC
jgi:hypothetical protein